ncbi:MAG TPA: GDP-mannose 4,6-dehydratase, partial [Bacteroidales bacterium]|nr:hypothetical protein [Bacteroidales bacterium]HRC89846.1 GDP-mannose 4,6-dehydratase [Bacteroidales bacterium]
KKLKIKPGKVIIEVDPRYFRPAEVDILVCDASKAKTLLGWNPEVSLDEMITEMVISDLELLK